MRRSTALHWALKADKLSINESKIEPYWWEYEVVVGKYRFWGKARSYYHALRVTARFVKAKSE